MRAFPHSLRLTFLAVVWLTVLSRATSLHAQVHYHDNDSPWGQRADSGPDAEVPGWFYNLGITGLRAQLVEEEPQALLIKYVFPGSPGSSHVETGDFIIGAGGQLFKEPHRNGYGENFFGADGPVSEMAKVLEECQSGDGKGNLSLTLRRGNKTKEVVLNVGPTEAELDARLEGEGREKSEKFLVQRIGKLVKQFPGYAGIRKVAVAREKWTIDNGMITPTMKLKRNAIFQKYANAIDDMYKGHVL